MAFVFLVTRLSNCSASIHHVSKSTSAKIGVAPVYFIALAVATQVNSGTITSSPSFIPHASKDKYKAPVQEDVANAYLLPTKLAKSDSNLSRYLDHSLFQPVFTAS